MFLRELPDATINVPLREIVVRAEEIEYPDLNGNGVTFDVYEFVDRMLSEGLYPRSAIPRDALLCASVHSLLMTFESDSLAEFTENITWSPTAREDIREGLERFGFDELGAVFADLDAFVARINPEWFETDHWWEDPALLALAARLARLLPFESMYDELAQQIEAWPYLRVVPAAQYQDVLKEISEGNRS